MKHQDWIKSISDIEVVRDTQEPWMVLKINGKLANIAHKQNYTAIRNGCLAVVGDIRLEAKDRSYFQKNMPPIEVILFDDLDNEIGRKDVTGFTNDPRIVQAWIDAFGQNWLNSRIRKNLEKMGYKF